MNPYRNLSRRHFLNRTAAATGLLLCPFLNSQAAPRPGSWPIACRDAHLKQLGKPDCWAAMKELGVDGVEVEVNEQLVCYSLQQPQKPYTLDSEDAIRRVRDDFAKNRRVITAFCMHNRLEEQLEAEVEWTQKLVAAAVKLGVNVIRIDVYPRRLEGDEAVAFAIRACTRLCQTASGTPVRFGLENHGKLTNDPVFLEKLFNGVGSDKLGLTLDFMNFYWWGHPLAEVYHIYEKFAPRAFHTHCKNLKYPEDRRNIRRPMGWEYGRHAAAVPDGDIDYRRVAAILKKANYRGDLCLENESVKNYPSETPAAVLKREIALLCQVAA